MLNIFNICKQNPTEARQALSSIDSQRKINMPSIKE